MGLSTIAPLTRSSLSFTCSSVTSGTMCPGRTFGTYLCHIDQPDFPSLHAQTYRVFFPIADTVCRHGAEYLGERLTVSPGSVVPQRNGDICEWIGNDPVFSYVGLVFVEVRRRMHERSNLLARALAVLRRHEPEVFCTDEQVRVKYTNQSEMYLCRVSCAGSQQSAMPCMACRPWCSPAYPRPQSPMLSPNLRCPVPKSE